MGYIVYVTDKHRGPQAEMSQEELKSFPVNLDQGTWYEFPDEIRVEDLFSHDKPEISDKIIRLEPSDNAIIEEQNRLKSIIELQQARIMQLERVLKDMGVTDGDVSAIQEGNDG